MNVYGIHRKSGFNIQWNVKLCSSKKVAELHAQKMRDDYDKWYKSLQEEVDHKYGDKRWKCTYDPDHVWIEKMEVFRK